MINRFYADSVSFCEANSQAMLDPTLPPPIFKKLSKRKKMPRWLASLYQYYYVQKQTKKNSCY